MSSTLETLHQGTLKIAAFTGFAPFAWHDGTSVRGRDIAFLYRFARAHRLELEVGFHAFDRLWELPARDSADIAASGISLRPSATTWSQPYSEVRRTLLIRTEDADQITTMSDLGHLAVVPSSAAHDHALDTLPATASLTFTSTLEHGIEDLLLGNIDALGTGSVSAQFHASRHPGLALVDVHQNRPPEYISFAVRSPLVAALNAFIAAHANAY